MIFGICTLSNFCACNFDSLQLGEGWHDSGQETLFVVGSTSLNDIRLIDLISCDKQRSCDLNLEALGK